MRELRLFFGVLFILIGISAKAQSTDKKVTLEMRNVPIETCLEEIKKQTGINFLYNAQAFKGVENVSVKATNEAWSTVLKRVLEPRHFTYGIKDGTVVIRKSKEPQTHMLRSHLCWLLTLILCI